MHGKYFWSMVILAGILSGPGFAVELEDLRRHLRDCGTQECLAGMQKESEQIFDQAAGHFEDDFVEMGNTITLHHCRSLIEEIFYHLETLKPYYNFKDVFYLKKLKRLRDFREQLDRQEISAVDFERLARQLEVQQGNDVSESQAFIDAKVARISELRENLKQNVEAIKNTQKLRNEPMPPFFRQSILTLKDNAIWQEFAGSGQEGRKIRETISSASHNTGKSLLPGLKLLFAGFDASAGGFIFPPAMVSNLADKHPID